MQELVRRLSRNFDIVLVFGDLDRSGLLDGFSQLIYAHLHRNSQAATPDSAHGGWGNGDVLERHLAFGNPAQVVPWKQSPLED